jgi:hypothetical protein
MTPEKLGSLIGAVFGPVFVLVTAGALLPAFALRGVLRSTDSARSRALGAGSTVGGAQ